MTNVATRIRIPIRIRLEAFAKVNRSLVVLGRRPDGYHEIDTLFETIDLSDRLTLEAADELSLSTDDPSIPAGRENLVLRAAAALRAELGSTRGAAIRLEKRIPAGAGLGGGSSDAAAALRGLSALWGVAVDLERLHALALALGSDVPFFLVGGRARGRGRGERLDPLPDQPAETLVLLFPPFPLSTPRIYAKLMAPALTGDGHATKLRGSDPGPFPDRNDLEPAAESLRSEVREMRESLVRAGASSARLSGSGSAVFGVFSDPRTAREAAAHLRSLPDGTRVEIVETLPRAEFQRRSAPRIGDEVTESFWGVDKR